MLLTGCTMGPDYKRPEVQPLPASYRFQLSPGEATSYADLSWWAAFQDPALQKLIAEAVANNYDVQIAASRIEQARAQLGVARSEAYPQLNYTVTVGGQRALVQGLNTVGTADIGFASGLIDAAWELDIWGRIRRSTEAARANLFAQEEVRRGVMLTLATDVASGYFRLLQLDRQLAVAEESTGAYKKTFDLFDLRFRAGKDSNLSVQRAEAIYNASLATAADLKRQIAQQENALCVLLGSYPRAIARARLANYSLPATPLGATSDLMQRRPDIRAAEQSMVAANAEIGVAVANFFPRIGLSAIGGGEGVHLAGTNTGFGLWSAGLSATGPIFNGGRLQSIYEGQKAYWDETVAQYRKTVLVAFRETSDALTAQQNLATRRDALEAQVVNLRQSFDLALTRYDGGRASYFEVLEAQQQLYPVEGELAQTEGDQLLATVSLYKVLGGGWKMTPAEWKQAAAQ
ncbi:MAG TPA: efflux transporter outer membrane subunit [Phenylobacterium sp.]|uniref:efflux transporter outer membrane subunit n=1 Tax=Phenylobacterium sp. TaxID=1871053 RepID=UPI002B4A7739|nr:efflux transporter outer membrane subunit [Phenylobacterium sp.]HKR89891.1 efflux transporter outer membrane subunit [Phenylobacterium sp.]